MPKYAVTKPGVIRGFLIWMLGVVLARIPAKLSCMDTSPHHVLEGEMYTMNAMQVLARWDLTCARIMKYPTRINARGSCTQNGERFFVCEMLTAKARRKSPVQKT